MIYIGWAFTENEAQKAAENCKEYKRLSAEQKFQILNVTNGYNHNEFCVKATKIFTGAELLLFVDDGNLCFGGHIFGVKDNYTQLTPGTYHCKIYTD